MRARVTPFISYANHRRYYASRKKLFRSIYTYIHIRVRTSAHTAPSRKFPSRLDHRRARRIVGFESARINDIYRRLPSTMFTHTTPSQQSRADHICLHALKYGKNILNFAFCLPKITVSSYENIRESNKKRFTSSIN